MGNNNKKETEGERERTASALMLFCLLLSLSFLLFLWLLIRAFCATSPVRGFPLFTLCFASPSTNNWPVSRVVQDRRECAAI